MIVGTGMTSWWCILSLIVTFLDHMTKSKYIESLKGICFVSGLCIGFGYYTFCFLFYIHNSKCLQIQLYRIYQPKFITVEIFFLLDFFIHGILVFLQYQYWIRYCTTLSIMGAFLFHRIWSLVQSNYKKIYFQDTHLVYGFSPLPRYVMTVVYIVEFFTLFFLAFFRR